MKRVKEGSGAWGGETKLVRQLSYQLVVVVPTIISQSKTKHTHTLHTLPL